MFDTTRCQAFDAWDMFLMRAQMFADVPVSDLPQNEFGELARNVNYEVGRYTASSCHQFVDEANAACDKLADLLKREHQPRLGQLSQKFERRQVQALALIKCYVERPYNKAGVEDLLKTVASAFAMTANDVFFLMQKEIEWLNANKLTASSLANLLIGKTAVLRTDISELCANYKLPSADIMKIVDDDEVRKAKAMSKPEGHGTTLFDSPISSAEQEQLVRVALLPDANVAIDTTLGHLHPLVEEDGFTCIAYLEDLADETLKATVRKVLSAGAAIGLVRPDEQADEAYQVHSDFYRLLARLRLNPMDGAGQPRSFTIDLHENGPGLTSTNKET